MKKKKTKNQLPKVIKSLNNEENGPTPKGKFKDAVFPKRSMTRSTLNGEAVDSSSLNQGPDSLSPLPSECCLRGPDSRARGQELALRGWLLNLCALGTCLPRPILALTPEVPAGPLRKTKS